jgi:hypothetical protein
MPRNSNPNPDTNRNQPTRQREHTPASPLPVRAPSASNPPATGRSSGSLDSFSRALDWLKNSFSGLSLATKDGETNFLNISEKLKQFIELTDKSSKALEKSIGSRERLGKNLDKIYQDPSGKKLPKVQQPRGGRRSGSASTGSQSDGETALDSVLKRGKEFLENGFQSGLQKLVQQFPFSGEGGMNNGNEGLQDRPGAGNSALPILNTFGRFSPNAGISIQAEHDRIRDRTAADEGSRPDGQKESIRGIHLNVLDGLFSGTAAFKNNASGTLSAGAADPLSKRAEASSKGGASGILNHGLDSLRNLGSRAENSLAPALDKLFGGLQNAIGGLENPLPFGPAQYRLPGIPAGTTPPIVRPSASFDRRNDYDGGRPSRRDLGSRADDLAASRSGGISVNISRLVGAENIHTTMMKEGAGQIKDLVMKELLAAINDVSHYRNI